MKIIEFIFKDRSLEYKFAMLSVLPIIIVTLLIAFYFIDTIEESFIGKTKINAQSLTELSALSISNEHAMYNKEFLDNLVDSLVKKESIIYAVVVDSSDERILAHGNHKNDGKLFEDANMNKVSTEDPLPVNSISGKKQEENFVLSSPVIIDGTIYGAVWVGFSLKKDYREIAVLKNRIKIFVFIAAILGVFFSISLARIFSRTIWVLAEQAKKIGMGDFDQKIVYHSKDALGRLSAFFNKMAEELKLNINRLEENEEKYHALFEASNDAVFMMDEEKILECNDYSCEMFGCTREDIVGQSPLKFSPPAQPDGSFSEENAAEKISAAFNGENQRFYWQHIRLDGSAFDAEVSLNPTHIANKAVLQAIVQDISERKRAEEKIKDYSENLERMVEERTDELNQALQDTENSRDRIDGILKSVADGLIVTDIHNRVILMNRASEDLLGVQFREVIDRPIDFAIKEKTLREKVRETLDRKTTGYQFDFELPGDDPNKPRIMRGRTSIIHDRDGNESGIVTIIHDVTHEREVDRMKTEFISTAAHELRTPLTSIQGFSELLLTREDLKSKEKKKFLTYIHKQSVGLGRIIHDLLDISRIESGRGFTLNKVLCDTGDAIKQIIPYFEENYKTHQFEVILPEKITQIRVDKEKMGQVLKNLLSNAVKYSPEGGTIQVRAEERQDNYEISVQDHGMGMTPEQVEKVFDKFYRVDASNTAIEGTGLGMSIVKHIIEAHGGKVWVESESGKGTIVKFTFPIQG